MTHMNDVIITYILYYVLAQYMYMCIHMYMYILRYKNLLRNTNTTIQRYNVIKTTCKCLPHINSSYFYYVINLHIRLIRSTFIGFHQIP